VGAVLIAREQGETATRLEENKFWKDVFFLTDPFSSSGATLDNKQVLWKAEEMAASRPFAHAIAEARVHHELGKVLWHSTQLARAELHIARALGLRRAYLGDENLETLESRLLQAYVSFRKLKPNEKAKGIPEFREILAIQLRILGPDHRDVIEMT